jgi:hypothetical protein
MGHFLAFWGNLLPMLLMLLPIERHMLPGRLRLPLPVTASIESGRGLKSRRKPLVQLDPSCDPLYDLLIDVARTVLLLQRLAHLYRQYKNHIRARSQCDRRGIFMAGGAADSTTNRPATLGVCSPWQRVPCTQLPIRLRTSQRRPCRHRYRLPHTRGPIQDNATACHVPRRSYASAWWK